MCCEDELELFQGRKHSDLGMVGYRYNVYPPRAALLLSLVKGTHFSLELLRFRITKSQHICLVFIQPIEIKKKHFCDPNVNLVFLFSSFALLLNWHHHRSYINYLQKHCVFRVSDPWLTKRQDMLTKDWSAHGFKSIISLSIKITFLLYYNILV